MTRRLHGLDRLEDLDWKMKSKRLVMVNLGDWKVNDGFDR